MELFSIFEKCYSDIILDSINFNVIQITFSETITVILYFRCLPEDQITFEALLNSRLKEKFPKQNQTRLTAKITAEQILKEHPKLKAKNNFWKRVQFGETYFTSFFKRHGWKWSLQRGSVKYFPKKTLENEIKRNGF